MRLFGFEITRAKAAPATAVPVDSRRSWYRVFEPFAGAWQRNIPWTIDDVTAHSAVFACITLIANDIGKLRPRLVELLPTGIWREAASAAFSPLLRRFNRYQDRIKFLENWITSKLMRGNTYALKQRDNRGVVTALYILDPCRVQPLVAPDGSVFYRLSADNLAGLQEDSIAVPASEIIHDRMNCLFHPLVGISPLYACGLAATQGLKIQNHSARFFENGARPGGILTAPGAISTETADRLKEYWDANYAGDNAGKVAVVGDGLKYESMAMNSSDSQLIEQLKWSAETVCSVFHVPGYKVGVGQLPPYNNIEALDQQYYSQCLQTLIESFELCMDEGLGLDVPKDGKTLGVDLDLSGLLRMDTSTRFKAINDGISGGWLAPNEGRRWEDLPPVEGGDTPYLQQQNYSLAALGRRDQGNPLGDDQADDIGKAIEAEVRRLGAA
jgi:HK97 family phage portal protein